MAIQKFEDLIAWQKAYDLCISVHEATAGFPKDEKHGLAAHLRKTAAQRLSKAISPCGTAMRMRLNRNRDCDLRRCEVEFAPVNRILSEVIASR